MPFVKSLLKPLAVILLCSYATAVSALDTLQIRGNFQTADVEEFGYVYIEEKNELNFEKIKNLTDSSFISVSETGVYFPPANRLHWLKYHIKNDTDKQINLLLVCRDMTVNQIQIFEKDAHENLKKTVLTGDFFNFSSREINHRFYLFEINIPAGETKTYYTFIDKYRNNLWLQFKIEDRELFYEKNQIFSFFEALYLGTLLAVCFISVIFIGFNRQRIFLYFSAFSFVTTLWIVYALGYGFKYIWFDFPDFNNYASPFCHTLHVITMTALARAYLDTGKYLPRADKLLLYIQYFFGFFFFYNLLASFMPRAWDAPLLRASVIAQLIYPITIAWVTISSYRKTGLKEQFIFLIAFLFTFIAMICLSTLYMGLLNNNFLTQYILYWLFGFDILTLIYLLSKRIKDAFTEKIRLQEKVNELKINAAGALIEGQQKERKRLSIDLHDGMSLRLAIIKMRLSSIFSKKSEEEQKIEVEILLSEMGSVSDDLRSFTHELSPLDLREQSLEEAIDDLIYRVKTAQEDMEISLEVEKNIEEKLSDLHRHVLYQVVQELLNNALKYSQAKAVAINLISNNTLIILSVKDNGIGFSFEKKKNGIGLKNIQLRTEFLSGEFNIKSDINGSNLTFSFSI